MFRRTRQEEYRRAVGMHYGPTRMHRAYTATMIFVPHYEPDCINDTTILTDRRAVGAAQIFKGGEN